MRSMFAVAGLSLLKTRKEKAFLIIMIGLAFFFTTIIGIAIGGTPVERKIPVGIADLDNSVLSAAMISSLETAGVYKVAGLSEADLYTSVRQGDVDAGFVIPRGFQESLSGSTPLRINVVSLATSNTSMAISKALESRLTEHLLARAVKDVALEQAAALQSPLAIDVDALAERVSEDFSERPALVVEFANVIEKEETSSVNMSATYLGVYLMFTMFTVVFTAGEILQERRDGTWLRLMAAPVSRASIMGGKVLGTFAVGAFQLAILLLGGRYLHKVDYGPNMLGVAVVLGLFLLAVTGLGIMLSTMVKTLAQLQSLAPIVIVSTCMLGGCYWPLDFVSPSMQLIARLTPQAWAMTALTDIASRGLSLAATWTNLFALLGFAALFFGIGVSRVKFE